MKKGDIVWFIDYSYPIKLAKVKLLSNTRDLWRFEILKTISRFKWKDREKHTVSKSFLIEEKEIRKDISNIMERIFYEPR